MVGNPYPISFSDQHTDWHPEPNIHIHVDGDTCPDFHIHIDTDALSKRATVYFHANKDTDTNADGNHDTNADGNANGNHDANADRCGCGGRFCLDSM